MALTFKTKGIVLKARDYKDADRLYTIFTIDHGKLVLRAQAVKKINSKLAGHLEPLNLVDLFIAQAKGFNKIGGAQTIKSYSDIKKQIEKIDDVGYCIKVLDEIVLEEEKDEEIFNLLLEFLDWVNQNKINDLVVKSFILKLFNILGHQPDFSKSAGDLARVLNFLSQDKWENIQRLRIEKQLWEQLNIVFNNFLKLHLK